MNSSIGCACEPGGSASSSSPGIWWRIAVSAFIAGNTMTFALAINVSEASRTERLSVQGAILGATLLVALLLGGPLLRETVQTLRRREIRIESLFVLSWIGAVVASVVSMLRGTGPVFFEVASILLFVYSLGRELGRYSTQRALKSLSEWNPYEQSCWRVPDGGGAPVKTPIAEIEPGDCVRVHPGQMIPVDGIIRSGRAFIHQADLTGESFAVSLTVGDPALAGVHVLDATLDIEATVRGSARTVDRITAVLEALRDSPSGWQLLANRLMQWFLPALLVLCAGVFTFWCIRVDWPTALFNTMAVLLVACPCVLGFATPLAVWTGLGKLAGSGLLARNGEALEKLATIDTLVFDKTGTLTLADASTAHLEVLATSPYDAAQLRQMIVATEQNCQHPIAQALRHLPGGPGSFVAEKLTFVPGVGVKASVRKGTGHACEISIQTLGRGLTQQLGVWVNGTLSGRITLEETLCANTADLVKRLEALHVHPVLITGDHADRAARVPIAHQHASASAEQKRELVGQFVEAGRRVLFVGDGTNDAAAMAGSTASIAVAGGSPLALDVGDLVWTRQDLSALPDAIATCREIARTVRTNVWLALGYNIVGITLAAAGMLHPVAATLLMLCSSAVVTWRSLQLLPSTAAPAMVTAPEAAKVKQEVPA